MCLLIADHDLGPADALLDLDERLLVLRPTLDEMDRRIASRYVLEAAGVVQRPLVITCVCGHPLDVDRPTIRAVG